MEGTGESGRIWKTGDADKKIQGGISSVELLGKTRANVRIIKGIGNNMNEKPLNLARTNALPPV